MVDFRPAMALCVSGIFTRYEGSWASLHMFPFDIFRRGVNNERFLSIGRFLRKWMSSERDVNSVKSLI